MAFISYAQNQEDVLLHRVFGGQETGFYIDIGAFDPVDGSVTKLFYDRGWTGLNIEPGTRFDALVAARPRDVNLRLAILDRAGEATFVENAIDPGTSRVVEETSIETDTRVACDTLANVVRAYAPERPIDFLKIDAEGSESTIVRSTDWRSLRPRILVIESTLPWSMTVNNQEWEPFLLDQGYERVFFDGINCFYVRQEDVASLQRHFAAPVNALDGAIRFDPGAAEREREWGRLRAELTAAETRLAKIESAESERAKLAERLARALAERNELDATLVLSGKRQDTMRAERDRLAASNEHLTALAGQAMDAQEQVVSLHRELNLERSRQARLLARQSAVQAERDAAREHLSKIEGEYRSQSSRLAQVDQKLEAAQAALAASDAGRPVFVADGGTAWVFQALDTSGAKIRPRRAPARWLALLTYRAVRPIARPMIWRLRSFMTSALSHEMGILETRQTALIANIEALRTNFDTLGQELRQIQLSSATLGNQWQVFAKEIEKTILAIGTTHTQPSFVATSDQKHLSSHGA